MKAAGFSLVEVLVATAVVAFGAASLAQLFVVSVRSGGLAHATATTVVLAQQKMEELLADAEYAPSPSAALTANTPGYFEYIDRLGVSLGGAEPSTPPRSAVYVRRWAIEPLAAMAAVSGSAGDAVVMKVLVLHLSHRSHADEGSAVTRAPGEARLVTVKTRKAG